MFLCPMTAYKNHAVNQVAEAKAQVLDRAWHYHSL